MMQRIFGATARGLIIVAGYAPLIAQTTPIQMPPLLIGKWSAYPFYGEGVRCDPLMEAIGITVTEDGRILANNGSRMCRIDKLEVYPSDYAGSAGLGSWSYEGECTLNDRGKTQRVPLVGSFSLAINQHSKSPRLHRTEDRFSTGSTWFSGKAPNHEVDREYERCPIR